MIQPEDLPGRNEKIKQHKDFQYYEQNGRSYFTQFTKTLKDVKINKYSKNQFSHWDVSYYSAGTQVIGEIKYRNESPTKYDNWMLQKDKYDELQNIRNNYTGAHIHYVNIYNDGSIRIWDITNLNTSKWENKYSPITTCGDKEYKQKEVTFLDNNKTIKVKKK